MLVSHKVNSKPEGLNNQEVVVAVIFQMRNAHCHVEHTVHML